MNKAKQASNKQTIAAGLEMLRYCCLCPRNCRVDRFAAATGYCRSDASLAVSSVVLHHGEEPVISGMEGICNIFFPHCNLQCVYCQNYQISDNALPLHAFHKDLRDVLAMIEACLSQGSHAVGFVSPSHMIPQMLLIVKALKEAGRLPVIVYNSNGYDKVDSLSLLEGEVDVYLPDFKYADGRLAARLSDAPDYPGVALQALKEMVRQKGTSLHLDDSGRAMSGIIIRHLVLPGQVENSLNVLRLIAKELSVKIPVSLMSQYHPSHKACGMDSLAKRLDVQEYERVILEFEDLGFHHGYIQSLDSSDFYLPDFENDTPFG